MPSTLVHLALAGLLACALLGWAFSTRALAVVLAAVVFVDLDVFLGWVVLGAHRSAFHSFVFAALVGALLAVDLVVREESWLVARFGETAPRVAGVTWVAIVAAAIGPDLVTNGVNALWPLHDQFYSLNGNLRFSTRRGVLQTFIEEEAAKGSTKSVQYRTGVDPDPKRTAGQEQPANQPPPERIFFLIGSGLQALLIVVGAAVTSLRVWEDRD